MKSHVYFPSINVPKIANNKTASNFYLNFLSLRIEIVNFFSFQLTMQKNLFFLEFEVFKVVCPYTLFQRKWTYPDEVLISFFHHRDLTTKSWLWIVAGAFPKVLIKLQKLLIHSWLTRNALPTSSYTQ